jgi:DNA replication licensing factor MCM5
MEVDLDATSRGKRTFTPAEETRFIELSRRPDIYKVFASSIAPSIFGNDGTIPYI